MTSTETPVQPEKPASKSNRWFLLINGIVLALFGVGMLFYRGEAMHTLLRYAGFVMLAGGAVMLVAGINNIRRDRSGVFFVLEALVALAAGITVLFFPDVSVSVFVLMTGIWCLILGVIELVVIVNRSGGPRIRNIFLLAGLLTLALGVALFFNPFQWPLLLLRLLGAVALLCGLALAVFPVVMMKSAAPPLPTVDKP